MNRRRLSLLLLLSLVSSVHSQTRPASQPAPVALVGAHLIPVDGPEIDNGVLVLRDGKIAAIGTAGAVAIPADAQRIDMAGKTIMPGLVDSHSHIGGPSGGDDSGPIAPETRALDSINVRDATIKKARAGGVTTVNIMPGSGHLNSGQTVYLKLRDGGTIDDFFIFTPDGRIAGGMKMANGTNSIRAAPFPGTRAKSFALMREELIKAQEYRDKVARATTQPDQKPDRDLGLEALCEVLDGKRMVHFHTHRHDDILSVLRLQKEFGFRVVLHHVSEGYKVPQQIVAANAPCSVIVIDCPGGKPEAAEMSMEDCAILDRAGALVAIHTDDPINDSRLLLRCGAMAVRNGLSREKGLKALTLAGAIMLDLQDRVGSLTVGKDADLAILSGDPFSTYTHVMQTYVEGQKVFDRDDPKDHLLAVGGYGASAGQILADDCFNDSR